MIVVYLLPSCFAVRYGLKICCLSCEDEYNYQLRGSVQKSKNNVCRRAIFHEIISCWDEDNVCWCLVGARWVGDPDVASQGRELERGRRSTVLMFKFPYSGTLMGPSRGWKKFWVGMIRETWTIFYWLRNIPQKWLDRLWVAPASKRKKGEAWWQYLMGIGNQSLSVLSRWRTSQSYFVKIADIMNDYGLFELQAQHMENMLNYIDSEADQRVFLKRCDFKRKYVSSLAVL